VEKTFEVIYEDGLLLPLGYFTPEEWEAAKHDGIGLDEVRRALASIPGSFSDSVIDLREER
jgi:hypothetical protein